MTAFRSFFGGLRQGAQSPFLVLTLYVFNLAFALPLAMMFRSILASTFGDSMALERFLDGFDYSTYQDFLTQAAPAMSAFWAVVFWTFLVYVLVNTLLAGGTLTILGTAGGRFSLGAFFSGCGRFVGRFFRLFLIYALLVGVSMTIVGLILGAVFGAATGDADSEITLVIWGIVVASIGVTILGLLLVSLDFAKVATVRWDMRSMIKATGKSLAFVVRRVASVLTASLLVLLMLAGGTAVYLAVAGVLGMDSDGVLVLAVVLQQIYVLYRIYLRVAFYGCELSMHAALEAEPQQEALASPAAAVSGT